MTDDLPKGIHDGDEDETICRGDDDLFEYDAGLNVIRVFWGGYDYEVDLDRVKTPLQLLEWVAHLSGKGWKDTTPDRIGMLIEDVCQRKGWDLWGAA